MRTQIEEREAGAPREEKAASVDRAGLTDTTFVTSPSTSALASGARFLQHSWLGVLATSAAVLVPCFWHKRIEAGDLGSHTYNAWLAQSIERGQAPGLWLANQ